MPLTPFVVSVALLLATMFLAVMIGPVPIAPGGVLRILVSHLPLLRLHSGATALNQAIVWDLRAPRVVLAALVGSMLAGGGAAYQGVFRNPLADPYLLGIAAGAGLGATVVMDASLGGSLVVPVAAFGGAVVAVAMTYVIGAAGGGLGGRANQAIILAGVAVAALFTAFQTYLQQQHSEKIQQIYNWLLGSFATASWSDVTLIVPYVALGAGVLLAHRKYLDILRVGEDEAGSLGVHVGRTRLLIVAAATL
ncbi:MAG: FecCD family ABC transporter permease, partial [Acidimicrobiales bacterium]